MIPVRASTRMSDQAIGNGYIAAQCGYGYRCGWISRVTFYFILPDHHIVQQGRGLLHIYCTAIELGDKNPDNPVPIKRGVGYGQRRAITTAVYPPTRTGRRSIFNQSGPIVCEY